MPNQSTNIKLTAEISATSKGLVDALKQASHAVNETSSNWKDRFSSLKDSTSVIGASVKNLADLISKVGDVQMDVKGMENIKANIAEVSSNFNAVKGEIDSFTAKLVEMKNAASEIGMPIDEYQRFTEAVKASGVQMDEAVTAISAMKQNIADFANGVPEAQQLFSKLGITLEQVSSQGVAANFVAIANAINDTIPASERATQNMNLFKASIDKTLAVAEAYNKTISKQTGTYATDKDVQNAISLSSAIQKLGEQLGSYMSNANGVANANDNAGRSFSDLLNVVKTQENLLSELFDSYSKYVDGLENTITSTTNATDATRIYENECERLFYKIVELKEGLSKGEKVNLPEIDTKHLEDLYSYTQKLKDKIKSEVTAIQSIMNQRIKAGAPVDTKLLEDGLQHVLNFSNALRTLEQSFDMLNIPLPEGALESIQKLNDDLDLSIQNFRELNREAINANNNLDLRDAENMVSTLNDRLKQVKDTLKSGNKVEIDTSDIDKTREKLESIKGDLSSRTDVKISAEGLDTIASTVNAIRDSIGDLQGQLAGLGNDAGLKSLDTSLNNVQESLNRLDGGLTTTSELDKNVNNLVNKIFDIKYALDFIGSNTTQVKINTIDFDKILADIDKIRESTIEPSVHVDTTKIDDVANTLNKLKDSAIDSKINLNKDELDDVERRLSLLKETLLASKVKVDTKEIDALTQRLQTLRETTVGTAVKVDTKEIEKAEGELNRIKDTVISTNVKVDTKELDDATQRLRDLKPTIEVDRSQIDDLVASLQRIRENVVSVKPDTTDLNKLVQDIQRVKDTVIDPKLNLDTTPIDDFRQKIEDSKVSGKIEIREDELDTIKNKLDEIKKTTIRADIHADTTPIDNLKAQFDNLRNEVVNARVYIDASNLEGYERNLNAIKDSTLNATVTVDASVLDRLRNELDNIRGTSIAVNADTTPIDRIKSELDYLKDTSINARVEVDAGTIDYLRSELESLKETTLQANVNADTTPIDRMRDELDNLKNVSVNAKVTVSQDELDRLAVAIENLRTSVINTNVKVDTTELLNAQSLIQQLKDGDINPKVTVDTAQIDALASRLQEIRDVALAYGVEIDTKTLDDLEKKLQKVKDTKVEPKVKVDSRYVDRLRDKINGMKDSVINLTADAQPIDSMIAKIDDFKAKVAEANKQASMGTPIWRPITIAMNKVRDIAKGISTAMRQATSSMEGFKNVVNQTWNGMTRVSTDTTKSGQSIGKVLGQATGQVVGMGSAVAIVATAWRNVVKLVKEYCENLEYARKMELYGNAGEAADDIKRINDKNEKKQDDLAKKLAEFADLYDEERNGSQVAKAKRLNLQDELAKQYGFEFKTDRNGNISDLNKQIRTKLEQLRQSELGMIEAALKSNREVANGAQEYIDSFNYGKRLFTFDDEGKIKEAQERRKRATDEILSLTERKFELQRQNPSQDYQRLRNGKAMDNSNKMIEEERKRAQKAWEERDKALADAKKKLQDWSNSLTDNDRQKAMREIMDKYNEAVKAGVNETKARIVAEQAIADMLKKEKESEDKKNKELLDAMKQKIEQYKSAYKEYQNAQQEIRNAQREEAETIREVARENRRERLQKRRERIQKRLSTFKFTPYEGFKMNESATERRKRVNTQKLDASISEKMQRQYEGKTVSWTRQERERFEKYNRLQRKDRQLEAALKQMDAADKQQKAAEALIDASDAIRSAVMDRNEAYKELKKAGTELNQASKKRPTQTVNQNPNWILNEAKRNGLRGRGVSGGVGARQYNYKGELKQLQNELTGIYRNTNNKKSKKDNVNAKAVIKEAKRRYKKELNDNKGKNRTGLQARGVTGRIGVKQYNYSQQFDTLHRDLQELNRRVFVVK